MACSSASSSVCSAVIIHQPVGFISSGRIQLAQFFKQSGSKNGRSSIDEHFVITKKEESKLVINV